MTLPRWTTLLCPVRACRLPLVRQEGRLVCARQHSFDIARSGYVNLLQPADRRSKNPGDTEAALDARRRLHQSGVTQPLRDGIGELIALESSDRALDAGCGDGFYLGSLAESSGCAGCGVDISTRAIDGAARRYPSCEWVVANADRFIPYADQSFSAVLSITARMNAAEFRRILAPGGRLLVALPSPEDLAELRGPGRDRVARTLQTFKEGFELAGRRRVTTSARLTAAGVQDVLHSIYRPLRSRAAEAMQVTFSLDLLLFRKI